MTSKSPSIFIIGGASLDTLHFRGQTVHSAGGAGLYTALAACRAGARVTMFAPRPRPMLIELKPAAERLNWIGPVVLPDQVPRFEIAHYGDGRAELVNAWWGAEALLTVENLPSSLPADIYVAYCGPLADPARQLEFVEHFNALGYRTACGTYGRATANFTDIVRQTLAVADVFFCNENEARLLFGSVEAAHTAPGKLLFVTQNANGAWVIQGAHHTHVAGVAVDELDPTGAGDTFCGTVLASLALGLHPVMAVRRAMAPAAEMVTDIGPAALLRPPPIPAPPGDSRVQLDEVQVERIAALIGQLPEAAAFDFVGETLPPVGHPAALDYFFAGVLQQFGFWTVAGGRYRQPMIEPIAGQPRKGSDYLWMVYRRWLDDAASELAVGGQAQLTLDQFAARCRADHGDNPLPAFELHLQQARSYGHDMQALGCAPAQIVARANASTTPLRALLAQLDHVGGYKEDPLRKKSALLAIILQQRPEQFLRLEPSERVPPIIDYHLQRSCLRTGLVRVRDAALREKLLARQVLTPAEEWAVRLPCYLAIEQVQRASGKPMGAVDWFFFQARRRCPEMTEPQCASCAIDSLCAHDKLLFQPVLRTTFY